MFLIWFGTQLHPHLNFQVSQELRPRNRTSCSRAILSRPGGNTPKTASPTEQVRCRSYTVFHLGLFGISNLVFRISNFGIRVGSNKMGIPHKTLFVSIVLFLVSFWFYRYQRLKPILPKEPAEVLIEGKVAAPPYFKSQRQYLEMHQIKVLEASDGIRLDKVRVRFRSTPRFSYGDQLRIRGQLTSYATMRFPEIEKIGNEGNTIRKALFRFREHLEGIICQALPEPEAGLLSGILLGSRHALPCDWEDIYKRTGLMHVVVASGFNITVLVDFLGVLARPLGNVFSTVVPLLGVVLFTLMLGTEPPIVRAAIMGMITLWGRHLGRPKDALRILLFSGLVMAMFDPLIIDSLSFKLSFAASLGLVFLASPLQECFELKLLKFFKLDEHFFSTVSASLFVFPIISYYFGRAALGSFLVNTLVLWVVPYSMVFGFTATFLGLFSSWLSRLTGSFAWLLLRFFNTVAMAFSKLPLVWEGRVPLCSVFVYYLVLFALCWFFQTRLKKEENR